MVYQHVLSSSTPMSSMRSMVNQHLLWVKVLNIVDVLSVFYPFAPNAQQAARCQVLDNIFPKFLFKKCFHPPPQILDFP